MRGKPKLIQRNDSPFWFIYVPPENGQRAKRLSTGETDYSQAEAVFAQWIIEGRKPELNEPELIKVIDILERYAAYKSADQTVEYHMRRLTPYFGAMALSHLTNITIREYCSFRRSQFTVRGSTKSEKHVSFGTIRRELDTLSAAIGFAHREGYIPFAVRIERPAAAPPREKWLTESELDGMINASERPYLTTFLMLARHTAARPSSILELKWDQIDLEARLIHYNANEREQTKKHRPTVFINDDLLAHLRKAHAEKSGEHVIATSRQGKRVASIKRAFKAACERAGVKGATPYTLRHTAITTMVRKGFSLAQAGQVAGHKEPRTTLRYAKHDPSFTRDAVASLATGVKLAHISPENAETDQNTPIKKVAIQ